MSRLTEIKGFVVYDIFEGKVFQRGKMHGKDYDLVDRALDKHDIWIVIGLAPNKPDPNFQRMHRNNEIEYIFYPIPDGKLSDEQLKESHKIAIRVTTMLNDDGGAVLCHCNGGRNRSGLMSALILRELIGATGKEALEMVRKERPNAIANEHFEEYLLGLD